MRGTGPTQSILGNHTTAADHAPSAYEQWLDQVKEAFSDRYGVALLETGRAFDSETISEAWDAHEQQLDHAVSPKQLAKTLGWNAHLKKRKQ